MNKPQATGKTNDSAVVDLPRKGQRVLLLGATGLVGSHCLSRLLSAPDISRIYAPTRRTLPHRIDKLYNTLVDFDRIDEFEDLFDVDSVICCLGTTIRQAGSKAAFRRVDYDYSLECAQLARSRDAKAFYLVSAVGADPGSLFFYNRVKGELEQQLQRLEFNHLSIYQPSLLLGERTEFRLGEKLAVKMSGVFSPLLAGNASRYKPIRAQTVAQAMVNECCRVGADPKVARRVNYYEYDQIVMMAKQPDQLLQRS